MKEAKLAQVRSEQAIKFPGSIETKPISEGITFGEKGLTKTQVSRMAEDLLGIKFYKTKEQAIQKIKDIGGRQQIWNIGSATKVKVPKAPFAVTETGAVLNLKTAKLPKLKYDPFGMTKFKTYGVSIAEKIPKLGVREAQFSYGVGKRGQLTGLTLGVRTTPEGSQFSLIDPFKLGRKSTQTLYGKGGVVLKKSWFEPYIKSSPQIAKVSKMNVWRSGEEEVSRLYQVTFKSEFKKSARVGPGEWLKKLGMTKEPIEVIPTQKALKSAYKKGLITERQTILERITPKGTEIELLQVGVKKQGFPSIDETLFLGESKKVSQKYLQQTFGISKPELPIKQFKWELPKPKKVGGESFDWLAGQLETETKAATKQLKKLLLEQPKKVSPLMKPIKPRLPLFPKSVPAQSKLDFLPRMVGGLGLGVSEWSGNAAEGLGKMAIVPSIQTPDYVVGTKQPPKIIPVSSGRIKTSLQPKQPEILKPIIKAQVSPALKQVEFVKPTTKPAIKTVVKPIVQPVLKPITKPSLQKPSVIKPQLVSPPKGPQPPKQPKIIIPFAFKQISAMTGPRKTRGGLAPGFKVEIKKRGIWRPIKGVYTRELAKYVGFKKALGGAAASIRLRRAKRPAVRPSKGFRIPTELAVLFRPGKLAGTFVQKRKLRIVSPGEVKEISWAGARAKKKGAGPIRIRKAPKSLFNFGAGLGSKKKKAKKSKKKSKKKGGKRKSKSRKTKKKRK